ncbi:uncharacterized protein LOC132698632 [Cylas formicarius]|uniref:uncharacterized protein LOC132698632 n=1 Tax=Cylas formicarius TaxID=197179 RepID=UPI002958B526|nr:uncharacterized protein LOC132698632 [Cylas formicarius]
MLIGAGVFWKLIRVGRIELGENKPVLQNTWLGWVVAGYISGQGSRVKPKKTVCNLSIGTEVQDQLAKFWELEEPGGSQIEGMTRDEVDCENLFMSTTRRDQDGRFIVEIPLKMSIEKLGDSREMALRRFYSLERKFARDKQLHIDYCEYMREYEQVGHMTQVSEDITNERCYYLPHHAVKNEGSSTTRLRVVYDGSAQSDSGVSLNDLQFSGPRIQEDIISILLRFRQHEVAFCADIAKMYRQVWVREDQRYLQRILWRENPAEEVKVYNLNTVTFGLTSSPFLAVRCLQELAKNCEQTQISKVIGKDFYVDDLISGASSIQEALQIL